MSEMRIVPDDMSFHVFEISKQRLKGLYKINTNQSELSCTKTKAVLYHICKTAKGNCFYGHYSTNFEHAKREFIRRVNRHNEMFPEGNPSHVGDVIGDD